ncbi:RcnB family protein [Novosphingobium lentum]|uniref:RcnB family protein n=1 Tax=Novosphingobium lentum TaxID=145287 RepID=UPI00082D3388|nr:RcnB family protein [Novosphingobium lentum]
MNRKIIGALSALGVLASGIAVPASAQDWQHRSDRHDQGRDGGYDRGGDNRHDRRDDRRNYRRDDRRHDRGQEQRWHYYGGNYGYNGYQGSWRTGQRYPHYNQDRYVVSDYGQYGLPAPRRGYRYYRDNNGDVVMAAIATGVIGLIIGGALAGGNDYHRGY